MDDKMKVVCPKCKAKLRFDPARLTAEVTRIKCPGCGVILRLKKPTVPQQQKDSFIRHEKKPVAPQPAAEEKQSGFAAGGEKTSQQERKKEEKDNDPVMVNEAEAGDSFADEMSRVSDSRREKRVNFKKKVLVNNQIMVEVLNISENGLFLHTGRSFEDGAVVEVGIPTQPGSFDLKVKAEVRHNHRGIGMGLQFVEVDADSKMQLQKLIRDLEEQATLESLGRKKILLVGGTDTARNINKSKLVLDGFYVLQATNAEEVFKVLEEDPPDALVVDWQEPKFNCKGLLAQIDRNPANNNIIRVVLSALTDSQIQKEILNSGAHKYMAKMDTNPAKLSNVLKQLIEERDGSA